MLLKTVQTSKGKWCPIHNSWGHRVCLLLESRAKLGSEADLERAQTLNTQPENVCFIFYVMTH